jgi:hypothetical protein
MLGLGVEIAIEVEGLTPEMHRNRCSAPTFLVTA